MNPYYQDDYCTIYHGDCRDIMPSLPKVDLVLTDPPYGIGENSFRVANRGKLAKTTDYGSFDWDKKPIEQDLINSLFIAWKVAVFMGWKLLFRASIKMLACLG